MIATIILTITCTPTPNSTGLPGEIAHVGGDTFAAHQLPPGVYRDPGFGVSGWNLTGMTSWAVAP